MTVPQKAALATRIHQRADDKNHFGICFLLKPRNRDELVGKLKPPLPAPVPIVVGDLG
jgi:hypothetical protein